MANHKSFPKSLQDILDQNDYNNLSKLFNQDEVCMLNPDKVTTEFDENKQRNSFIILGGVVIFVKDTENLFIKCDF